MWETILSFITPYLSSITKYVNLTLLGITIISILLCWYLYTCKQSLEEDLAVSNSRINTIIDIYNDEMSKAKSIIDEQNNSIKEYKFSLDNYIKTIRNKERELSELEISKQQELNKELSKDSSTDNQVKIMNRMMKEFSEGK